MESIVDEPLKHMEKINNMRPIFVTSNQDKLKEAERALGFEPESEDIELEEIQAVEAERVVKNKVERAYEKIERPVMVTDVGVYIDELNGFPGALIKWMFKRVGNEGIAEIAGECKAEAITVIGYHDGEDFQTFEGTVKGKIAEEPRGDNGFGWDPVFVPEGYDKTFAEMTEEEKNKVSMRKKALEKMKKELGK